MSADYLAEQRELERQENEQRRMHNQQEQERKDQYNTLDPMYDYTDYKNLVNTSLEFAPKSGQTWLGYYQEIQIHAKIACKINRKAHIFGKNGHWHTHVDTRGCFMCEDNIMISTLVRVIGIMSNQNPTTIF